VGYLEFRPLEVNKRVDYIQYNEIPVSIALNAGTNQQIIMSGVGIVEI
jgi:hypothetical protein